MLYLGRQLRAILWKNALLKKAHYKATLAEILLPVFFMTILILIKQITTVYDSPNVAYHCGNTYPWHYAAESTGSIPFDCTLKNDTCSADNYYRDGYSFYSNEEKITAYSQLGYIDSGSSSGQSTNSFYTYTVADASTVYSSAGVDNPSLPLSDLLERLSAAGVLLALAPNDYSDILYEQVELLGAYILNSTDTKYQSTLKLFQSEGDMESYVTDRDYDDDSYEDGKVAMAIVLTTADQAAVQWDYSIRTNFSYPWEQDQDSVACLYSGCELTYSIPSTQYYTQDLLKPQDSSFLYGYTYSGFSTLQLLMDQYILSVYNFDVTIMASIGLMPTDDYLSDDFQYVISSTLGIFYMLSFLYPVSRIIRGLVVEKEERIKEGMKMMGLTDFAYNLSWFITILAQLLIVSVLITLVTSTTVFEYSDKFLVFIYFAAFSFAIMNFCFLMATFFSRAKVASLIGPMVFFGSFFPYYAVSDPSYAPDVKTSTCLLAPACFALGANVFADYEGGLVGVQWSNSSQESNNFSYSLCVGMLVVDALLYGVLAWYFDKIIPSEFGTHLVPWFPFLPSYWCGVKKHTSELDKSNPLIGDGVGLTEKIERVPSELLAQKADGRCVSVTGLRKVFQTTDNEERVAVKALSMDIFEGQCTVLLGHNGAGKSTTMGMLTGLLPPTSGDATIRGLSINDSMREIRTGLGVCPQHDILFPELTVRQHLQMFAVFKGVSGSDVDVAAEKMIAEVGLKEKADIKSSTLSGGQKRKLSVGIALIGDSKVVILDEPTSGMDPFSRRSTWNIIQRNKKNRVILLTTHFMDEADILGDRIAIMAHGELRCFGSSLYLKKTYGVGYTFTIEKAALIEGGSRSITDVVKRHVAEAEILSNVGAEQSFRLPFQAAQHFVELFREIEAKKEELRIAEFGISVTTLEEVFIRVGKNVEDVQERASIEEAVRSKDSVGKPAPGFDLSAKGDEDNDNTMKVEDYGTLETDDGFVTFIKHFKALFTKRFIYGKRDKRMVMCQLVLPVLLVVLGLGLLLLQPGFDQPDLKLTPGRYNEDLSSSKQNFVPFNTLGGSLGDQLFDRFTGKTEDGVFGVAVDPISTDDAFSGCANGASELHYMSNYLINEDGPDNEDGSSRYGSYTVAEESTNTELSYNMMVNGSSCHGVGIYMNLMHTALLQVLTDVKDAKITVHNFPLPRTWQQENNAATADAFTAALFVMIAFCFVPASYATFIVKEREVKAKHQQIISGVSIYAYWTSSWVWDFLSYLPTVGFVMILCFAYDIDAFTQNEGAPACFLLFALYGPAVASFTYVVSFLFTSHSTAQLLVMFLNFLTGLCLMIVSFVLTIVPSTAQYNIPLRYVYRLFPSFCLGDGLTQLALCDAGKDCPSIDSNGYNYDHMVSPLSWDITGGNITFLAIEAVVYFAIAVFIEWSLTFPKIVAVLHRVDDSTYSPEAASNDPLEDPDVRAERERVTSGGADGDVVKLNELRKVYATPNGNKVAVKSLSFGIPKGECFGFLGINGAGKTTTLSILSGEFPPTSGSAFIDGFDISQDQSKIRRKIGYCPQFDALLELLTVREHLELFARIKGIPQRSMEAVVRGKLEQLDLTNFENKAAGSLSGGNKRKLSVAIALIGEPSIVFLDEPSTGMDPMARRHMWEVISRISTQDAKCSIILTTHSMEESEALCTRIGIMVNGRLRCLGSAQHLKLSFGNGYEIDMKTAAAPAQVMMSMATNLQAAKVVRLQNGDDSSDISPMLDAEPRTDDESSIEEILTSTMITMPDIKAICSALMESERLELLTHHGEGSSIITAIDADGCVSLKHFLEWWIAEDYACKISDFMREEFVGSVLLERSTANSFRYRIPTTDCHLADIFDKFESNKLALQLEDYSVGQTTLEQIFNQFASSQDNPEMEKEHMELLANQTTSSAKPSTNSSKSSFGVDGKPLPAMKAPPTAAAPFKRTSTNTSFSKSASLTGGVF